MVIKNGMRNLSGRYIELDIYPETKKGFDRLIEAINPLASALKAEELRLSYGQDKIASVVKAQSFAYIQSMAAETKKIGKKIEKLDVAINYYAKYQNVMESIASETLIGQDLLDSLFELKVIRQ